jgi:hypothetical protein
MSAVVFILLILLGIAAIFCLAALFDRRSSRRSELLRIGTRDRVARQRQDAELSTFLVELHRQNRETYRRLKEAAKKA